MASSRKKSSARRACLTVPAGFVATGHGQGGARCQFDHRCGRRRYSSSIAAAIWGSGGACGSWRAAGASRHRSASRSRSSTPSRRSSAMPQRKGNADAGLSRTSSSGSPEPSDAPWLLVHVSAWPQSRARRTAGCSLEILGGQRVVDGQAPIAAALVPRARPPERRVRHLAGSRRAGAHAARRRKSWWWLGAHRRRSSSGSGTSSPVQRLQRGLAATLPGDGIARWTAQRAQIEVCSRKLWTRSDDATAPALTGRPHRRRRSGHLRRSRR